MHLMQKSLFLVALCWLAAGMAPAGTIQLEQGGWAYGGPLNVTFTGTDANGDGKIGQIELTAFKAVYAVRRRFDNMDAGRHAAGRIRVLGFRQLPVLCVQRQ